MEANADICRSVPEIKRINCFVMQRYIPDAQ
jgi:hypothetical protein